MFKLIPLLPVMYVQSRRIRKSVPKLPEAIGSNGVVFRSNSQRMRVVMLGESTFAGVGVETHKDGFGGSLAYHLSEKLRSTIDWAVYARSGYTARKVGERLLPLVEGDKVDMFVIGLGGNDAFEFSSPKSWSKNVEAIISVIGNRFGAVPIVFANMPPVRDFPAFTPLLHRSLGAQVDLLGITLKHIADKYPNVYFDSEQIVLDHWLDVSEGALTEADFFSDGVHPSQLTYQTWAEQLSRFIAAKVQLD